MRVIPKSEHVAHGKIDPYGVVLPVDPVGDVIKQLTDGGLLQGHGGQQAATDQSRPHLPDTVPVPRTGQRDGAMCSQQAVESALTNRNTQTHTHRLRTT